MKTQILFVTSAVVMCASFALASSEKWTGSGTTYNPQGDILSTYQLTVENTEVAPQVVQSEATSVAADGTTKVISQKITTSSAHHFKSKSNLGTGGGACYSSDVCESYIVGKKGLAYATTIIIDGPRDQRHLTIVLKDGKAIKFLRDKVTRLQ